MARGGRSLTERNLVLDRGLFVAVRDGDTARAEVFARLLREAGLPQRAGLLAVRPGEESNEVMVPGGIVAVMRVIGGRESINAEDYFLELSRIVTAAKSGAATKELQDRLTEHFDRIRQIESLGVRTGNRVVLHLSARDRTARRNTERILNLLGWTIESSGSGVKISPAEKRSAAERQITTAALILDDIAMQEALQSGRDFEFAILDEQVPVILGAESWREAFIGNDTPAGGLSEVFATKSSLGYLYIGLANLDDNTAADLARDFGLKTLEDKYCKLLYHYSASLVVRDGRVALPGGLAAAPVWQRLVETDPMSPKQFISALLRKDEGKLLAFFASLMQLDPARQTFFTLSGQRASRFYELFKGSPELRMGAGVKRRSMTFSDFMRQLPLDDQGHVMFPGSPEVWMVARGQSSSVAGTAKLLKRVSRVTTPDIEDAILLRLAGTAYTSGFANLSELDNFLAVAHVDAHRLQPLDEASALLLAQHYARHLEAWPFLAVLPALEFDDYARFFRLSEDIGSLDRVSKNEVLGELSALLKILCLLFDSGRIDPQRSTLLFRGICESFLRSGGAVAEYASASMESTSALLEAAKGTGRDADEAIREALLEHGGSVILEFNGKQHVLNGPEGQSAAYREVLELQKAPALAPLQDLYRFAHDLANFKGIPAETAAAIATAVARLPEVGVPDAPGVGGEAKEVLSNCRLDRVREVTSKIRKEVSKKKPKPKTLASLSRELLAALNPQVRLALTGILYAYYMSPRDTLVSDDPLFLRRHQFVKLDYRNKLASIWESPEITQGKGAGSHFIGGFADFGFLAGTASLSTSRQVDEAAKPVGAAIIGSLREIHWSALRETELHAAALQIRAAREWVTNAAYSAGMISALSDATLGILTPSRRADLLRALAEHHWDSVWQVLTLSDLYFLGEEYLRRFNEDPVTSPVLAMLRAVARKSDPERIRWLGSNPRPLFDCSHPHLMRFAPYEYYEGFLLPDRLAVRTNEFKLYLAEFVDRRGLLVGFLHAIAEPIAIELLRNLKMTMYEDWRSVLAAFARMDDRTLQKVLERK